MGLTTSSSLESERRKFFMNSTYIMSRKQESNRFWAHEAEITLTAISSMDSARRKFFINSTYIMYRKKESNVFGSGSQSDSNSHQLDGFGEKKIFHQLDVHHVQKEGIKRFWAQEAKVTLTAISSSNRREENFSRTRLTSCLESRNQAFLGSGGLNDTNSHHLVESARRKFFINSTYIMSRKQESSVFGLRRPK